MTARKRRAPWIVPRVLKAIQRVLLGEPDAPPDAQELAQELARRHDGWSKVPSHEWDKLDRAIKKWKRRR
jgi:hypothetical protein